MPAVLFGSISSLADTSELQRQAFNDAFSAYGLDWEWSRDDYRSMLGSNGGAQRIADYAAAKGADVDAAAVHAKKSEIFQSLLASSSISPREGVVDVVEEVKRSGQKLGLVTTTSKANVDALLSALEPHLDAGAFDLIVDLDKVSTPKPDPAAYAYALEQLGEDASHAVAIEDNPGGVKAATAAGIDCVAFPNENTAGSDFASAAETVNALDAAKVVGMATS
ncbi:phosphatase [Mycolicibacterium madagascariense]|uniref:Phosphatase n=1 Tax=Mycolicibacterium madagascariense TaxID=212765 RepID=A0A7I7XIM2_9MYCO|nr:HAD-IA family hydrolase [Mycolicibacterium madagascariense]MCV7011030.1 HAD-IA family hydrolase [Mycolicibacterium madagascariense]BBZ29072.1 phosphatase [Mycolicibacterium madagascariense]